MHYSKLLMFILFLLSQNILAQEESLVTDRPDQTEASSVVLKNSLQGETGVAFGFDNEGLKQNSIGVESLWRFGLLENMELRLILRYQSINFDDVGTTDLSGLAATTIGTKIAITEEKGLLPEIAFIGHLTLPYFGKEAFIPEDVEPSFRFCFTHTLSERLSLGYNLGMEWEGAEESGIYTLVLAVGLTDRLGLYVEPFGTISGDFDFQNSVNAGLTYLVNNDFQLDLTGGLGVSSDSEDAFVSMGFSWRIKAE
jgi:hypothetical protein